MHTVDYISFRQYGLESFGAIDDLNTRFLGDCDGSMISMLQSLQAMQRLAHHGSHDLLRYEYNTSYVQGVSTDDYRSSRVL